MAATLVVKQHIEIVGLGGGDESRTYGFTSSTTPTETVSGKPIIGSSAFTLDLGDITIGKSIALYIEAIVGNVYVFIGSTTPVSTNCHLYILEGQGYTIPINPDATAVPSIKLLGSSATCQIRYILVGKA